MTTNRLKRGEREGKGEVKFVDSVISCGRKVLMHNNNVFHRYRLSGKKMYFSCKYQKESGCPALVILYNFNAEDYSFDHFTLGEEDHLGHPKKKSSEEIEETIKTLEGCRHVCLFCFADLPSDYGEMTELENAITAEGVTLTTKLRDPVKNEQAFKYLCHRLGVNWRKCQEGQNFDRKGILPLCFHCQCLYQEMFQLNLQVRQLEDLINSHVKTIKGKIKRAERQSEAKLVLGGTQLTVYGLDVFRQKVLAIEDTRQADPLEEQSTMSLEKTLATSKKLPMDIPEESGLSADEFCCNIKEEIIPEQDGNVGDHDIDASLWASSPTSPHDATPVENEDDSRDAGSDNDGDAASWRSASDPESEEEKVVTTPRTRSARLAERQKKTSTEVDDNKDDEEYVPSEGDSEEEPMEDDNSGSENDCEKGNSSDSDFEASTKVRPKKRGRPSTTVPSKVSTPAGGGRRKRKKVQDRGSDPQKEFTCHICSATEIGYPAFVNHYKVAHPDEDRYTCKYCKRRFVRLRECEIHQYKHTGERPYQCSTCPAAFPSKTALTSHIFRNHTDRPNVSYPCPTCKETFSSKFNLGQHRVSEHNYTPPVTKRKPRRRKDGPTKEYRCHVCSTLVKGYTAFVNHYKIEHPNERRYSCVFCKRHYDRLRECEIHQRKHTGERPFLCSSCPATFSGKSALRSHVLNHHTDRSHIKFPCPDCQEEFPTKSTLIKHRISAHDLLPKSATDGQMKDEEYVIFCMTCHANFGNEANFKRHNKRFHNQEATHSEPVLNPTPETLALMGIEVQHRTRCHVCWETMIGKVFLEKHFREHHPNHKGGLTTCQCGKKFKLYKECVKHAIRHSTHKTFQCEQCPLRFFTGMELRSHRRVHDATLEERKCNVCDICGMKLVSPSALQQHRKKHEGTQLRSVCEVCGRDYAEKKGLYHHIRTEHLNIKPHKCSHENCGRAFALKGDLEKHFRSHTGAKPFSCPHCDKTFPYTGSRARHIREVHRIGELPKKIGGGRRKRRTKTVEELAAKKKVTLGAAVDTISSTAALGTFGDFPLQSSMGESSTRNLEYHQGVLPQYPPQGPFLNPSPAGIVSPAGTASEDGMDVKVDNPGEIHSPENGRF